VNIGSGHKYPEGALSNFTAYKFTIDEVECESMEGFLQSLKFDKVHIQREVCKLIGLYAKRRGSNRNKAWKSKQVLWWNGEEYPRKSEKYQQLISRAYDELAKNKKFIMALKCTGSNPLYHTIGKKNQNETVLTESEFCGQLIRIRKTL
jgi:hypothetical protein